MNSTSSTLNTLFHQLQSKRENTFLGGGEKKIAKHKSKGKLTARERVDLLLDQPNDAIEIGTFTAYNMYEEHGGCPSAGVVVKLGKVSNRLCVIVANDATVKAGAWFPLTGKKNLRAQEIAIENNIPIIYLVDSAGVYLPMQDEIFPDKEHFGRIFRNNAVMSAQGIPQIAAIMGSCVAGGAYLPIMSDEALIVDGTGSVFLAGSYLVKSAIGESIDNETLGGATTHCEISGVTDYKCENDEACLQQIKDLVDKMGHSPFSNFNKKEALLPNKSLDDLESVFPEDRTKPYNMIEIIERLVDESIFEQYKEGYGQSMLCGYARIEGWAVGIVANQRTIVKNKKGEMQMGGVIYSDAADKAARFIMNCNQKKIPLLFIHDVTGFMVGSRSEHGGIIKDGAKMVNAMSNSVVPKFSLVIGNSYGAGNYAMCGKAYDPRLMLAWPTSKIAVMSGKSAATTLLQIKLSSLKSQGKVLSEAEEKSLFDEIKDKYDEQLSPYYAAARLWVDEIILPEETRKYISTGIEAANQKVNDQPYTLGVIQT
ncbi:acyl-CoA carboxylase subunit beta [Flammeovirga yaeyamensis]|uniref:Acyl-CoA carboxylase subunit beta n=1 Tax=Flammeovirga yaeyamensis TaxID=367791 RepID=A0AAX1MYD7_9BACT|nr:acyl-CoA carboxylase subunit beta [Flammeovirga yaeyamensis]MBB3696257.1 acetyl-CoA carboxylase carboxyltransferase component [Flammeovirga yaeyamensis]NMF34938.1 acyl-CoA carboxylase subunit beta [Flammeovirga yaeyamensis]QWG00237.1 acyl-CoA carboxylase subunit beta [Flammeovirga yaeyamensis]